MHCGNRHRQHRSPRKPRRAHNRDRGRLHGGLPQAATAHPLEEGLVRQFRVRPVKTPSGRGAELAVTGSTAKSTSLCTNILWKIRDSLSKERRAAQETWSSQRRPRRCSGNIAMIANRHFREPRAIPTLHPGKVRWLPIQARESAMPRIRAHRLMVAVELTGWDSILASTHEV